MVHVPLSVSEQTVSSVLLLGSGDGLAARELLKYPNIKEIIIIDLDPNVTDLAKNNIYLKELNQNSLNSKKVTVINQDAFNFLINNTKIFDLIIADLPDPNNSNLTRLYSKQFYKLIRWNLSENGIFVTQATSPYFTTDAFEY